MTLILLGLDYLRKIYLFFIFVITENSTMFVESVNGTLIMIIYIYCNTINITIIVNKYFKMVIVS